MSDTISRDSAIEHMKAMADCAKCEHYNYVKCRACSWNDAMNIVEELPAVGGWISVEDRLPEKGKVVLAYGIKSASTGQFQGCGSKPWFWWWKGNTIRRVTYWMPLPEPPKE